MRITYNGQDYDCDEKFSFKDFTSVAYIKDDLSNKVIYASCFSKEQPGYELFVGSVEGTTFIKCNLDNILIPDGATVIDCSQRKFLVQNDLRDWEIDDQGVPTKVINEKYWLQNGFSVDKKDIPLEKATSIDEVKKV